MERTIHCGESCASQQLQNKEGVQDKLYHVKNLKMYMAREPEVHVVHTRNKDDATIPVTRVIYQDTDPELVEVPD